MRECIRQTPQRSEQRCFQLTCVTMETMRVTSRIQVRGLASTEISSITGERVFKKKSLFLNLLVEPRRTTFPHTLHTSPALSSAILLLKKQPHNMFWSCVFTDQCWWRWRGPWPRRQWRLRAASRCWCRWGCLRGRAAVRGKTQEPRTKPAAPTWRPGNLWQKHAQQSLNTVLRGPKQPSRLFYRPTNINHRTFFKQVFSVSKFLFFCAILTYSASVLIYCTIVMHGQ